MAKQKSTLKKKGRTVGFRISDEEKAVLEGIADSEERDVGNVLKLLVERGLTEYLRDRALLSDSRTRLAHLAIEKKSVNTTGTRFIGTRSFPGILLRRSIPIVGRAAAGKPGVYSFTRFDSPDYIELEQIDDGLEAIEVSGKSMEGAIPEGTIVVISKHKEPRVGDTVLVVLKNGDLLIKKLNKLNGFYILESLNREVEEIKVKKSDVEAVFKVVATRLP